MSAAQEMDALRASARRASCRVEYVRVQNTPTGPRARGRVVCPDGWAAARFLTAEAERDALRPDVQQIALMLRVSAPSDDGFARALHAFVKSGVAFVRDHVPIDGIDDGKTGERFTNTMVTLQLGKGDCDDHARALYALALAGGLPVRMAFLSKPFSTGPAHAVAQLGVNGMWWWAETTVDALFGEQPYDAAKRLGLLEERPDLATEVTTMSDEDLPPMPKTRVSSAEQIQRDAQALARLGFICATDADEIEDAADERFRAGVAAFQRAHGRLEVDGAIGPKTRGAIAGQLVPDEFGMGYIAATAQTTGRTAHLSSEFFQNTEAMAQRMRDKGADVSALDFYNAWMSESGVGRAKHGHGGLNYHGLNMMHGDNLPGLGWPVDAYAFGEADPADQIRYIERFYEQMVRAFLGGDWSKLNNATALYLMNFLPKFTKYADDPSYVLARKGEANGWWRDNPVFDAGRPDAKGYIEVADLTKQLERVKEENRAYWNEIVARASAEGGTVPPSGISRLVGLAAGATVVIVAAGILASVLTHGGDRSAVRAELRARAREAVALPGRVVAAVRR